MHRSFVAEFLARRAPIKQAWERRLRHEPVTSPLANPDTLVLLMDRTLDELAAALTLRCRENAGESVSSNRAPRAGCLCGLNPLLAYFRVGASVLPAVMCGAANRCPELSATEFASCIQVLQTELNLLAQGEIRSFCAMCQTDIARGGRMPAGNTVHHSTLAAVAGK